MGDKVFVRMSKVMEWKDLAEQEYPGPFPISPYAFRDWLKQNGYTNGMTEDEIVGTIIGAAA